MYQRRNKSKRVIWNRGGIGSKERIWSRGGSGSKGIIWSREGLYRKEEYKAEKE
jgi:hypothetical protein